MKSSFESVFLSIEQFKFAWSVIQVFYFMKFMTYAARVYYLYLICLKNSKLIILKTKKTKAIGSSNQPL